MNERIKLFNEQAIKYAQESLNDIAIVKWPVTGPMMH